MSAARETERVRAVLEALARGELDVAAAQARLQRAQDLGFAVVDHDRAARCGFPEVVFCERKEPAAVVAIADAIAARAGRVLLTRAGPEHRAALRARFPHARVHERARCVVIEHQPLPAIGHVALVAAGTGDLPVAEEARVTAEAMGAAVTAHVDVGVAGLHRLLERLPELRAARAVIAVAGMEGALPSVLAGQLSVPVIAVPTGVGYGASFGGLAALLAMLNSCAAGVAVVNVDNGFGAGYLAALINRTGETAGDPPGPTRTTRP
jgi:NCAIR mutase (PurE)-related protein